MSKVCITCGKTNDLEHVEYGQYQCKDAVKCAIYANQKRNGAIEMRKVEGNYVVDCAYEVVTMWGNDMGAFMAIGQKQFIERLAERLSTSNKTAQGIYVLLVNHGYMNRFEEDNASDWLVCMTQKAVKLLEEKTK